ncbi:MAG: hypothetical protein IPG68_04530 [Micrococcales bacterium]|nr:hypothetical protein [Micrococcales bacterium]
MQQEWPDLTAEEVRATAMDRLDLHYEHQDALAVERGGRDLMQHLSRFSRLQAVIGETTMTGDLVALGGDWVQITSGVLRPGACDEIRPLGRGSGLQPGPLSFRQSVRQYAGRVPREVVLVGGRVLLVGLDWVAADFLHVRVAGRPTLVPLSQVAAVLGTVQ